MNNDQNKKRTTYKVHQSLFFSFFFWWPPMMFIYLVIRINYIALNIIVTIGHFYNNIRNGKIIDNRRIIIYFKVRRFQKPDDRDNSFDESEWDTEKKNVRWQSKRFASTMKSLETSKEFYTSNIEIL